MSVDPKNHGQPEPNDQDTQPSGPSENNEQENKALPEGKDGEATLKVTQKSSDSAYAETDQLSEPEQSSSVQETSQDNDEDDNDDDEEDDQDDNASESDDQDEEEDEEDDDDNERMSLLDHLRELKKRLLLSLIAVGLAFLLCYAFSEQIFDYLVQPLLAVLPKGGKLIYTGLPEAFFTYVKVAFVAGFFAASPVVFYQVWAFIAPGLYEEEKRYITPIALLSAILFILGGAFAYFIVFPFAFEFFMSYSTGHIEAQPKLDEYLSFSLQLLLAFGLMFELPLFTFFLARMGVVTAAGMRRVRRYSVLASFLVAAILTPPDVVSQMLMAVPLLLLYEISILVAHTFGKRAPKATKAQESSDDDDETNSPEPPTQSVTAKPV